MKHFLSIILISCLSLTSCSDSGSDYVGNWVLRDHDLKITITEHAGTYQVSGYAAFSGGYVLDDDGRLVNGNIDNTRFEYNDDNDVIVWTGNDVWPTTSIFERADSEEQSPQQKN